MRCSGSISFISRSFTFFTLFTLSLILCLATPFSLAHASITFSGDVSPSDSASWDDSTRGYVGYTSTGTATITSGILNSSTGYIGYGDAASGLVAVDGGNSTWISSNKLYVGYYGVGVLNITNGGIVNSEGASIAGYGGAGTATVDGSGSTWNTNGWRLSIGANGNGVLNITNGGTVITANAAISTYYNGTGIVTVDGSGSTWTNGGILYVGDENDATLNITNGGEVFSTTGDTFVNPTSHTAYINFGSDGGTLTTQSLLAASPQLKGVGTVIAHGLASDGNLVFDSMHGLNQTIKLTSQLGQNVTIHLDMTGGSSTNGTLGAGWMGTGSLTIRDGMVVNSTDGYLGYWEGSFGLATVDGTGSVWNMSSHLSIGGCLGKGTLNVLGGGHVVAPTTYLTSVSLLSIDAGHGSLFSVGGGTITNNGKIRCIAGAGVEAGGQYTPIQAGTWSGTGIYRAVGGTLNTGTHEFTVSEVVDGTAGTPMTIDLALRQRVLISDSESSWNVGASFLAAGSTSSLTFTASAMDDEILEDLEESLGPNQPVLGAWDFTAEGGYAEGDPAYLSFDVGEGYSSNGLRVWHYDGSEWAPYDALDLTYDGTYASFTVTGFSGYAVAVPEPAMMALLSVVLLAGLLCRVGKAHQKMA